MKLDSRVGATKHHTREEKVEWWARMLRKYGVSTVEEAHLKFGDFSWEGNWVDERPVKVGAELKTVPDFIGSLNSGRLLGHQIPGMINTYEFRYLFIEGIWKSDEDGMVQYRRGMSWIPTHETYHRLASFMTKCEVIFGVHTRRSSGPTDTMRQVASLWKWWRKPFSSHSELDTLNLPTQAPIFAIREPSQCELFLMTIQGVGFGTARRIAFNWPTMELLLSATPKDLMKVKGVGSATANKVWYALRAAPRRASVK